MLLALNGDKMVLKLPGILSTKGVPFASGGTVKGTSIRAWQKPPPMVPG